MDQGRDYLVQILNSIADLKATMSAEVSGLNSEVKNMRRDIDKHGADLDRFEQKHDAKTNKSFSMSLLAIVLACISLGSRGWEFLINHFPAMP